MSNIDITPSEIHIVIAFAIFLIIGISINYWNVYKIFADDIKFINFVNQRKNLEFENIIKEFKKELTILTKSIESCEVNIENLEARIENCENNFQ